MKKILTILTTLFVCFSNISMPLLAALSPSNTINSDISPYAIKSRNHTGDWTDYYGFTYDYLDEWNKNVDISFRIKTTYRYNESTGKVYGSAGSLTVEAQSKPYDMIFNITNVRPAAANATITSDGYAWIYPNVTFDLEIHYENKPNQTYKNVNIGTQYVPDFGY